MSRRRRNETEEQRARRELISDFLSAANIQSIDMAVRHPNYNGCFAIGIECDGAAYHSARTARERDRLRQAALESMGWKIHRIWSTDWIKDPYSEKESLLKQ